MPKRNGSKRLTLAELRGRVVCLEAPARAGDSEAAHAEENGAEAVEILREKEG
jgi:hypothetical protein